MIKIFIILSILLSAEGNKDFNSTLNNKSISIEKEKLVNEANKLFEDTTIVISRLTLKPYVVEASAGRASIAVSNMGMFIPVKYRDDLGRVGLMKNKPIIATAKKFLKFMKEIHKGQIIRVDNPKNYQDLCTEMCGKKGLYIMRTEDNIGYKLTGYIAPWDDTHVLEEKNYVEYAKEAWLFVEKP